jgi:hypothetical protein
VTGRPQKPSLHAALASEFAKIGDPAQVERRRRILLEPATIGLKEESLGDKIVSALDDGIPKTSREIAKSKFVRRRREVVEAVLAADPRFVRVPAPPRRSRRAEVWALASQGAGPVGTSRFGDQSEAA